jgi:SRSO17 transposase
MHQRRTEKKNFFKKKVQAFLPSQEGVNTLIYSRYKGLFKVYRKSCTQVAIEYVSGLLQCEKGHENMERMVEKVDNSDYNRYTHFLSSSPWSHKTVNRETMKIADELLRKQKKQSGMPTGLQLDETSHLKKGDKSVGVSRQYAGVVGKVDNCQVSVHASLSNEKFCTLIGTELFLPECWAEDSERCEEAGIPASERVHITKPALALKLVKQAIDEGVEFDFIAGDGLYGHNSELTRSLDALHQFYVLDIHKDELVYLTEPTFRIPERKGNKGRLPKLLQPDIQPIQVQNYMKTLTAADFTEERVRKTAKGWKTVKVHTATVWHWDGVEQQAQKRTLLITVSEKDKYSLSNGEKEAYSPKEWAYFQCSRYPSRTLF